MLRRPPSFLVPLCATLLLASCDSSTSGESGTPGSETPRTVADTLTPNVPTTIPGGSGKSTAFTLPVNAGDRFQITIQGGSASGLTVLRMPEGDTIRLTTTTSGTGQQLVDFQANWTGQASIIVPANSSSLELLLLQRVGGVLLDRWESDSSLADAPLAGSSPVSRTLHPGDDDYIQLPGSADSLFTVRIEGRTRGRASLLDSAGKVVRTISIPESAGVASTIVYRPTSSKPWGLLVESSTATDTGAYTVKAAGRWVLPVDPWECAQCSKSNDTRDTLVVGKPGSIRSLTASDFDRTMVRCDSGKRYLVKVSCQRPLEFFFRESDGLGRSGQSDIGLSDGATIITATMSGWVTLESSLKSPTDSATYSYEVSLAPDVAPDAFEPNNTQEQARSVSADSTPYTATLSLGDRDWYRFEADSGTYYRMELLGQVRFFVTMFRSVSADYIGSFGGLLGKSLVMEATKTGTMWFQVSRDQEIGTYGFRLSRLKVSSPDTAEPDNDKAHARALPLDSTILRRNMEPYGADWFRFQTTSGAKYTLTYSTSERPYADVYDSAMTSLGSSPACVAGTCSMSWTSQYTGPAYLKMSEFMPTFYTYTLSMKETPSP